EVRHRNRLTGRYRTNDFRGHDDHQFCIRPGLCLGLEEFTEDWNVADKRNFTEGLAFAVIQKSADCEALAFRQLDFRVDISNRDARNGKSGDRHTVCVIKCTHFRCNLQAYRATRCDRWDKVQQYAKLRELNSDGSLSTDIPALNHRVGELSSREKTRLLAILCQHVRLR